MKPGNGGWSARASKNARCSPDCPRRQGQRSPNWDVALDRLDGASAAPRGWSPEMDIGQSQTRHDEVAAVISLDGKKADYTVQVTPDGYALVVAVDPDFPNDAALQFWTLDEATPVSLGLLPPKGRYKLKRQLVPDAKPLISREPGRPGRSSTRAI